jgi:Uma2 family endonuclease
MEAVAKIGITDEMLTQAQANAGDGVWIEVEDGEIIEAERNMTFMHVFAIQNLYFILKTYLLTNKIGFVFIDGGRFRLEGTPDDIRRAYVPDLTYVRAERIPPDFDWNRATMPLTPDLAVEVISPGQSNAAMLKRIAAYLDAGAQEAWLIVPGRKAVYQYRRDEDIVHISQGDDLIDVSALFPGLEMRASEVFRVG